VLSLWSENSVLSIWSQDSVLSIGSAASFASIGSIGSFASAGSILSAMSTASVLSHQSLGSALSHQSRGSVLASQGDRAYRRCRAHGRVPAGVVAAGVLTVLASAAVHRLRRRALSRNAEVGRGFLTGVRLFAFSSAGARLPLLSAP